MTRDALLHLVRAACDLLDVDEVVVLGSQAILATLPESRLPAVATRSMEADIAAWDDTDGTASHLLSGVLGEDSAFDRTNGYYVDGVSTSTADLPAGWIDRAIRVSAYSVIRGRDVVGVCPDAADLCVSKLCALRTKDQAFVGGLLDAGIVDVPTLRERLDEVADIHATARERVLAWLMGHRPSSQSQSAAAQPPDRRA